MEIFSDLVAYNLWKVEEVGVKSIIGGGNSWRGGGIME